MSTVPTLANHFGVNFDPDHANPTIPPFIPSDDSKLILSCQEVVKNNFPNVQTGADNSSGSKFFLEGIVQNLFGLLALTDVVNLSQASKCCFLATKADFVWIQQFNKIFPKVKPFHLRVFSTEQQFKIYYKRMNDEKKLYKDQFERNEKVLSELDMELARAEQTYAWIGSHTPGERNLISILAASPDALDLLKGGCKDPQKVAAIESGVKVAQLRPKKYFLGGKNYGVYAIGPYNQQQLCPNAMRTGVPEAFNDQLNFTQQIQDSYAAKNKPPEVVVAPKGPSGEPGDP